MKNLIQRLKERKFSVLVVLALVLSIGAVRGVELYVGNLATPGSSAPVVFTELDSSNIQDFLLNTDAVILIEFYSAQSIDAQAQSMILDKALVAYAGKVMFCRLDVDAESELASKLGVTAPSFVMVHNGKRVNAIVGLLSEEQVGQFIEAGLKAAK